MNNRSFLEAIFGEDTDYVHVTGFPWDPGNIPKGEHLRAWAGGWVSRYALQPGTNQYFCVSIFNPDDKGVPRRRKGLFLRTRCIVLDDVREKLNIDVVNRLPPPSWILETSPGSEQWGYILDTPCSDRGRVENLLDGLVANGLAPDGKDPGMKGVTRYVRLPEGANTKASKLVDGQPWQCRLLEWNPWVKVALEDLAAPFFVDLDQSRRDTRTDGAADVPDHPILQIPDIIHIKEVRGPGKFDITCPWVDKHTGGADDGAVIFTNDDGTIGFKCHHGNCIDRRTPAFLRYVDEQVPGWSQQFTQWKVSKVFGDIATPEHTEGAEEPESQIDQAYAELKRLPYSTREARDLAKKLLIAVENLAPIDQQFWQQQVADEMHWSKKDLATIIRGIRQELYDNKKDYNFMDELVFVKDINQIYEYSTGIFMTTDALQNSYAHKDPDVKKTALVEGRIKKVDSIDFAPLKPAMFEEDGRVFANLWTAKRTVLGAPGDAGPWLRHFDAMGWGAHRDHLLRYMAWTLLHPDIKINHMIILGGYQGSGKDFLLFPLVQAEHYTNIIHGDELDSNFNDYGFSSKLLIVNEGETRDGDRGSAVSNKLKPLSAAPPEKIRINRKNMAPVAVRNIMSVIMTTNSQVPVNLQGTSRRIFALWSDLSCRDEHTQEVLPEWNAYWRGMWNWMRNGGYQACIWHLRNEVDLSKFEPGEPPPMTDFLRDMQESGKSLQQQTLEAFIRNRVGAFASDLLTTVDALWALKAGAIVQDSMYCDPNWFTPERVSRILKDVSGASLLRTQHAGHEARLWAVRNSQRYLEMDEGAIYPLYERMLKETRKQSHIHVVE